MSINSSFYAAGLTSIFQEASILQANETSGFQEEQGKPWEPWDPYLNGVPDITFDTINNLTIFNQTKRKSSLQVPILNSRRPSFPPLAYVSF